MPSAASSLEFDDGEDLGQRLLDEKIGDTLAVSDQDSAIVLIDEFQHREEWSPWWSLERAEVAKRLLQLIIEPRLFHQGQLNLCGPAAFYSQWAKRDPVAFAAFATELFDKGCAQLGTLSVAPSAAIVENDYSKMRLKMGADITPQADWYLLGGLRNSEDALWQGTFTGDPDEQLSAATRPEEIAGWFAASGIYKHVDNRANWMTRAGIPHAERPLSLAGKDVTMLMHMNMLQAARGLPLDNSWLLSQFPNHYVVLLSPVYANPSSEDVEFTLWSWGQRMRVRVPQQAFLDNYYGMVVAAMFPAAGP